MRIDVTEEEYRILEHGLFALSIHELESVRDAESTLYRTEVEAQVTRYIKLQKKMWQWHSERSDYERHA